MKNSYVVMVLFVYLAFAKALSAQNIERVEPPFWWAGMEHSQIEIMLYGEDLYNYENISSDLNIKEIKKTDNDHYLILVVDTDGFEPGNYVFNLEANNGAVEQMSYELRERDENSKNRKGFDSTDAIYLVMPDRFANGDTSNDAVDSMKEKANRSEKGGRHGGDIQGIIDHLDYLEDLGVTALWSTPLLEDNDASYSYHTYAQSDVYNIDPRYGDNERYRKLADELHDRDMKLIMDYVTNHWGATHWMMQDLPTKTWIHQFPDNAGKDFPVAGYANSSYRQSTQMDPNASDYDEKYAEKGWFVSTMPDLNQSDPLVLNYLIQNAIWWIEYAGLDGLRVDTYSYNEKEGIAAWTKAIMDEYPNFNIVGETWLHDQAQIAYWQKDSKVSAIQNYNSHLPSVMDFTLHDALMMSFNEDEQGWDKGMVRVYENFVNDFLYPDIDNILVFAGNHDTNRISGNGLYNGDLAKYKLAMTIVLTTRGIPQLYYGDEIGMMGNKEINGDGDIRRDFPGGWEDDVSNAFAKAERTTNQENYHSFTKNLLNFRKNSSAIQHGSFMQYVPEQNCYVYFRQKGDEKVMVVVNNNPEEVTLNPERFAQGLSGSINGNDILTQTKIDLSSTFKIAGKTSFVIDLN